MAAASASKGGEAAPLPGPVEGEATPGPGAAHSDGGMAARMVGGAKAKGGSKAEAAASALSPWAPLVPPT